MAIKIIHDQSKAIQEKAEKDAFNKEVMLPAHILGFLLLGTIVCTTVTVCRASAGIIAPAWKGLAITVAIIMAIFWLVVWSSRSGRKKSYSANLQYYLITKGKPVKETNVSSILYGRAIKCTYYFLCVKVEDAKGRIKEKSINLYDPITKEDVDCTVIDLINTPDCLDPEWGCYYCPNEKNKHQSSCENESATLPPFVFTNLSVRSILEGAYGLAMKMKESGAYPDERIRQSIERTVHDVWSFEDSDVEEQRNILFPNGKPTVEEFIVTMKTHLEPKLVQE